MMKEWHIIIHKVQGYATHNYKDEISSPHTPQITSHSIVT